MFFKITADFETNCLVSSSQAAPRTICTQLSVYFIWKVNTCRELPLGDTLWIPARWPLPCYSSMPHVVLPQGLCTGWFPQLGVLSPDFHMPGFFLHSALRIKMTSPEWLSVGTLAEDAPSSIYSLSNKSLHSLYSTGTSLKSYLFARLPPSFSTGPSACGIKD